MKTVSKNRIAAAVILMLGAMGAANANTVQPAGVSTTLGTGATVNTVQATGGTWPSIFSNTAIGGLATAGGSSTAIGANASATATHSVALGQGATTNVTSVSADGSRVDPSAPGATSGGVAVGASAQAGNVGTAVGYATLSTGSFSTAIGGSGNAQGEQSVALGFAAATAAGAKYSVAVGAQSIATESGTVSFGSEAFTRRLVNIADGVNLSDAVNAHQLGVVRFVADAALTTAVSASKSARAAQADATLALTGGAWDNTARVAAEAAIAGVQSLSRVVDTNRKAAAAGIAGVLATQQALPEVPIGKTTIGLGAGHFDGQTAVGVAMAHHATLDLGGRDASGNKQRTSVLFSGGLSVTAGKPAARVGASMVF